MNEKDAVLQILKQSISFPESNAANNIIPNEIFGALLTILQIIGTRQLGNMLGSSIGVLYFCDKLLVNVPVLASFFNLNLEKMQKFFDSNIFISSALPRNDRQVLVNMTIISPDQADWRIFEYPSSEILDTLLQTLFGLKYPIYSLYIDPGNFDEVVKRRVFAKKNGESISIEPSDEKFLHTYTMQEILAHNSSEEPSTEGKCWLLTQNL